MEEPQTFRSPTAVVIWVVWLLFAVGNWIDLAVQGRDHLSLVAAALLLLATGVAYVTAQRPRIIAGDTGVTIVNPLRDHRIGWPCVTKVDLVDLLRVHCDWGGPPGAPPEGREHHQVISAWAVHYSRRRQLVADARARRTARRSIAIVPRRSSQLYGPVAAREPAPAAEADAKKAVRLLNERATAARAEAVWANSTPEAPGAQPAGEPRPAAATAVAAAAAEPLNSTWSRRALAALVLPALILLIVCLV